MAATKARKQVSEKAGRTYLSVDNARDQLGTFVNRAAIEGERFVITRHGLPAAAIVSLADLEKIEGAA